MCVCVCIANISKYMFVHVHVKAHKTMYHKVYIATWGADSIYIFATRAGPGQRKCPEGRCLPKRSVGKGFPIGAALMFQSQETLCVLCFSFLRSHR